jgi:serine/threonine protein phosphatase PrpC
VTVRQDAPEREPLPGTARREPPLTAHTRGQRALGILIAAGVLCGVILWLAGRHLTAVIAVVIAVFASMVFVQRTVSARGQRSEGQGRVKRIGWKIIWSTETKSPSADGRPRQQHQQALPQAVGTGGHRLEYPPGMQGPLPPRPVDPPRPMDQPPPKEHTRGRWFGLQPPAGVVTPPPTWTANAIELPEPRVFVGPSTPGQAPWHLPLGTAPSGLAADGLRLGDLEARAASMVGAGHRCQEPALPRQDAYGLARTKDGQYLVIAIADGVSQSKHADLAARVAVSAATRELAAMVESGGIRAINPELLYRKISGEIVGTGRDRGIPDADVCAIVITAVIPSRPDRDGTRPMWASWIGDVSLWISRGGELRRMTGQGKTGLDRNELHAVLPFSPEQVEQGVFELHPHDRVVLMTDGVSDSLESVDGTLDYFARQWAGPPPHPAAFLHSLCYDGPGQTDDRTAVVVWCDTPSPGQRGAGEWR